MATPIKAHQYKDFVIVQTQQDLDVNGAIVPKGYVNLSQICRVKGKLLKDYLRNKNTLDFFIAFLEAEIESEEGWQYIHLLQSKGFENAKDIGFQSGLLIETAGDTGGDGAVYGHLEIAIDVAQWVDSRFRVWANKNLRQVLIGGFVPVTKEAKQAQENLQKSAGTLFGGGNISNAEYVDLCKECRQDARDLNW